MKTNHELLTPELIEESERIIALNYAETGHGFGIDIDWESYLGCGEAFICFTLRDENNLVGILFFLAFPYPHNKNYICAQQVTFYVFHTHRKHSLEMMKYSEEVLLDKGVDIIVQSARYDSSFNRVLERRGYEKSDVLYTKRIG